MNEYRIPVPIIDKLQQNHPELDEKELENIIYDLKTSFLFYETHHKAFNPSALTEDLWCEFILCTEEYQQFFQAAFGAFYIIPLRKMNE